MDPLAAIKPQVDSTFRIAAEARRRGYETWHYTPDALFYCDGEIYAHVTRVTFSAESYTVHESATVDIKTFDVVWLRQDPPFDMAYLTTTYMLERVHPKPFVVNNPASVRNLPEKWFPTEVAQFMAPTLIASSVDAIRDFRAEHKDVVIKPLYGHGGNSIFHVKEQDNNFTALMETLFGQSKTPWMVQKFLPEMRTGERRIIMIDGKMAAIAGRIPPAGETRASIRLGARYEKAEATKRHHDICKALGPLLKKHGLIFAGVDTIGDWLTEINITSPGSVVALNKLYDLCLEADIWDAVERHLP